jgi:hypothetical protein
MRWLEGRILNSCASFAALTSTKIDRILVAFQLFRRYVARIARCLYRRCVPPLLCSLDTCTDHSSLSVTLKAVATSLEIPLKSGKITAEGDLDFRCVLTLSLHSICCTDTARIEQRYPRCRQNSSRRVFLDSSQVRPPRRRHASREGASSSLFSRF